MLTTRSSTHRDAAFHLCVSLNDVPKSSAPLRLIIPAATTHASSTVWKNVQSSNRAVDRERQLPPGVVCIPTPTDADATTRYRVTPDTLPGSRPGSVRENSDHREDFEDPRAENLPHDTLLTYCRNLHVEEIDGFKGSRVFVC